MKSISILALLLALFQTSCIAGDIVNKTISANGTDVTGTIEAKDITQIDANQGITVNYTVGNPVSVTYTVPESLSEYLQITCDKGVLKCKYVNGISVNLNGRNVVVNVTAPKISEFEASSAAKINVNGPLEVDKLEIDSSSAATAQMNQVNAKSVDIESSSAASVVFTDLTAETIDIDASSSGTVTLTGSLGKVDIDASSAATVKLSGTCDFLNVDASSAATVNGVNAQIATGYLDVSSAASITVSEATQSPYKKDKSSGGKIHIK